MTSKERYQGIQTIFANANEYACLFLSLLSIAEDFNGKPVDFIDAYRRCIAKKFIDEAFFCIDQPAILKLLTGNKWTKREYNKLPSPLPDNMFTIEKWYNERTQFTHFKRRGYDTLKYSVTVAEGNLVSYYTYTVEV